MPKYDSHWFNQYNLSRNTMWDDDIQDLESAAEAMANDPEFVRQCEENNAAWNREVAMLQQWGHLSGD